MHGKFIVHLLALAGLAYAVSEIALAMLQLMANGITTYWTDVSGSASTARYHWSLTADITGLSLVDPYSGRRALFVSLIQQLSSASMPQLNEWARLRIINPSPPPALTEPLLERTIVFDNAVIRLPLPQSIALLLPDRLDPATLSEIVDTLRTVLPLLGELVILL